LQKKAKLGTVLHFLENLEVGKQPFPKELLKDDEEFDELSFEDYWEGDGLSVIEWAERAE